MVYGDGLFKPSLLIFDIFSGKNQLQLSKKQALYEILEPLKFAVEHLKIFAEPPKFSEDRYSGYY